MPDLKKMTLDELAAGMAEAMGRAMVAGVDNDFEAAKAAMRDHAELFQERESRDEALSVAAGPSRSDEESVMRAASGMLFSIGKIRDLVFAKRRRIETRIRVEKAAEEIFPEDGDPLAMDRHHKEMAICDRHLDALNRKDFRLRHDPKREFLPLGTVVRFTGAEAGTDALSSRPNLTLASPGPGTVAVVTGLSMEGDHSIMVSPSRPWRDRMQNRYEPHLDAPSVFRVNPEQVEVMYHGVYPDGTECREMFLRPTHARKDGGHETIILADGLHWRLHDSGGAQGIEPLSAHEDMTELSWLEQPRKGNEG